MANPPYSGDSAGDAFGWGPARSVRASGLRDESGRRGERPRPDQARIDDGWSESTRSQSRRPGPSAATWSGEAHGLGARPEHAAGGGWATRAWTGNAWSGGDAAADDDGVRAEPRAPERGLPAWLAVLVLLVIAAIGGIIDMLSGTQVRGGFNVAIVVASLVAILIVRRSGMFPIVIAPPIVYSVASGAMVYLRTGGLSDHKALYDAAANWLVYGFPAIACATAAVLIVAGVRLIVRR